MRKCLGQGATKQVSKARRKPALPRLRPALEMLEDRRMLAIVAWDGGGDGTSWDQAINWDGDVLPGIDDDVIIDVADQDVTVRIDSADSWKNSTPTEALSIIVEGTDQETPANDLILNIFTQPALGSVAQTGALEFSYTPPKGGLTTSTDFTFVLRDDGREGLLRRKRLLRMLKRFRPLTLSRLPIQSRVTPPWVTSSTDSAGG